MFSTRRSLAEIIVLAGGVIPPAPAVPSITRISDRPKRVLGHGLAMKMYIAFNRWLAGRLARRLLGEEEC